MFLNTLLEVTHISKFRTRDVGGVQQVLSVLKTEVGSSPALPGGGGRGKAKKEKVSKVVQANGPPIRRYTLREDSPSIRISQLPTAV